MEFEPLRHQCLVYDGAPSRHLAALARTISERLAGDFRCMCFDSPPMMAGMRSYLAAEGVDVAHDVALGRLVFVSERSHLVDRRFEIARMTDGLSVALDDALDAGFRGLWCTGDIAWEFGPERDFSSLLEYERQLDAFIDAHPEFGGVCQYHRDTLPSQAVEAGLLCHPRIFVDQTLSLVNPRFISRESFRTAAIAR
ncbi:MAG TPA: MEDS domain-containing protein [Acidobacteriaceae bacterium]